ncbi:MAG TPA: SpoIIE family protein phosphatase [Verrucomicrobiae bacterium]|nr:SpoIIE family protein phosphatase [Verrucomicrobiae bacterium]
MVALMTQKELSKPARIDYGVAARTLAGQPCSGDACFVNEAEEQTILAVIDGLGHGPPAADAAATAVAELQSNPDLPLVRLIERCHRALLHQRGVAMTLVSIPSTGNVLNWVGVGNVWGGLFVAAGSQQRWRSLLPQMGIVGHRLPRLRVGQAELTPGDWLVVATDGVSIDFDGGIAMKGPPREVATGLLTRHFKGNDDALVLAARYPGEADE